MKHYEVFYKDNIVGTVCINQIGLYTELECQCTFPQDGLYRIVATHRSGRIDMGICLRDGDIYVIKAKIPSKYIVYDDLKFCAFVNAQKDDATFLPVEAGVQFDHIAEIMHAKFCVREGRKGVLISED